MSLDAFMPQERRILIEHIEPEIDCGRYPIKRVVGDSVAVQADIFRDGHGLIAAALQYRPISGPTAGADWQESPMRPLDDDRWAGSFTVTSMGRYCYRVVAWNDDFGTWRHDMERRILAGQVSDGDVQEGISLVSSATQRMPVEAAGRIERLVTQAHEAASPLEAGSLFLADDVAELMHRFAGHFAPNVSRELEVVVDPVQARFSSWYELFPRSQSTTPGRHGTLADVVQQLPRIAAMGFDILYLPPIHPVGRSHRKGPNNALEAAPEDVGSPWAIGNENGGHKSIEPALGTFEDFERLVQACTDHGMQLCLDYAIQCSPDHPYVREHPDWFYIRPDGSIKYAENPPKKYQDIYPLNFYCDDRRALWEELLSIVLFWIERGVKVFRVDNPHTKPIPFWEWLIAQVKERYPDTIFLAEAFTRPIVMRALAKAGFTQSYTYFTWRNTRWELTEYLTELTQSEMRQYFRGNLWPNTPDILHDFLQRGGLPAFKLRLVLAATLSSAYGIYSGYELGIATPAAAGSEEYLGSDKYQVNLYDWTQPHYLGGFIGSVNRIRRDNPALHLYDNLRFYQSGGNDNILAYGKATAGGENRILVVVNLDPFNTQETWIGVPFWEWGFGPDEPYEVHDLLTGATYTWRGEYNFVRLDPDAQPAHIFRVRPYGSPDW